MDYPFSTDGCTLLTPIWQALLKRDPPWNDLCVEHDRAYWRGGTTEQRREADRVFRKRVADRGHPTAAWLMWLAVRIGGHPLLPVWWRWGYGWRWPKGYEK